MKEPHWEEEGVSPSLCGRVLGEHPPSSPSNIVTGTKTKTEMRNEKMKAQLKQCLSAS